LTDKLGGSFHTDIWRNSPTIGKRILSDWPLLRAENAYFPAFFKIGTALELVKTVLAVPLDRH